MDGKDVEEQLRWEPGIRAEQISVSVRNGVVELSGMWATYTKNGPAERAVFRVANVKSLATAILVDLFSTSARTDEHIASAATIN